MSLDQIETAKSVFNQNGPSELLSLISEEEKLSPEAEELLIDIGSGILAKIVEDACFSAKSRGSDTVEQSDLNFITEPWLKYFDNNQNETKTEKEEELFHNENAGSIEHQQRLELIRRFMEEKEQDSH